MMRILSELAVTLSESAALSLIAKGTVVLSLALAGARFARKNRAAVRHALLASAFGVLLALPVVSFIATPVRIAVPVAVAYASDPQLFDSLPAPAIAGPAAADFRAVPEKSGSSLPPLSTTLLYAWFVGAVLFAIPIVSGLLQIRSLRRFALPWREGQMLAQHLAPDICRRVDVLLHESLPGPMMCGVRYPAIILPADAQTWNAQDLRRAIVHELAHVRRYDWAIRCMARISCAVYWFHPLVWIAWRRLDLDAERSCDDAVLGSSDATAYADQLVGLARRLSASHKSPALAMANRSDLTARVGAVLDATQRRGPVGALLVVVACIAAAAIALTVSPLQMVASPQGGTIAMKDIPKWDAVSVKRCTDAPNTMQDSLTSDRMMLNCKVLEGLVNIAYNMFADGKRNLQNGLSTIIEGFPDWTRTERYAIEAKTEGSPGPSMMNGPMLQAILEDRFRLKVHRETREGKVYILSVATGGPKMATSPPGGCTTDDYLFQYNGPLPIPPPPNPCPRGGGKPPFQGLDGWMNMDTLTFYLSRPTALDAPLLNKTGLAGAYHVQLQWMSQTLSSTTQGTDVPLGPSIFTAVQKLGLKIEAGKGPRQFLVFDHAERPSEN